MGNACSDASAGGSTPATPSLCADICPCVTVHREYPSQYRSYVDYGYDRSYDLGGSTVHRRSIVSPRRNPRSPVRQLPRSPGRQIPRSPGRQPSYDASSYHSGGSPSRTAYYSPRSVRQSAAQLLFRPRSRPRIVTYNKLSINFWSIFELISAKSRGRR